MARFSFIELIYFSKRDRKTLAGHKMFFYYILCIGFPDNDLEIIRIERNYFKICTQKRRVKL